MDRDTVPGGRVRLTDVARHAGVSMGTVSNTLNHPERVTPDTRERVMRSVRELEFIPNQQARVLTGLQNTTLGLIVVDVLSPFFMQLAHAVERTASAAGFSVIFCNSENDRTRESQLLELLTAQRVTGVLLTPAGGGTPDLEDLHGTPLVLIDYEDEAHPCSVRVDHVTGGRLAAEHLIGLGHRRLAFVGGLPVLHQFEERAAGIRQAMAASGLDPSTLVELRSEGINVESGEETARRMVEAGDLPTGICCGNDMLAFGVYRGLDRAGIRVPDDVSLVGYDDMEFAQNWIVPLTTVHQPTTEMGMRAARLLLDHAADGMHEHQQIVLQPELVVRRSSGALRTP